METLIKAENFMRKAFVSDESVFVTTRNLFLWHYSMIDSTDHTEHCRAIYLLYIYRNKKLTKQRIAVELFTNVRSLKKDRVRYRNCFFRIYRQALENRITEESAISSLF